MNANESFENINKLLLKRKPKDFNAVESTRFSEQLENLLYCEGISNRVESFLYSGYSCCGAMPLHHYLNSSSNCLDELHKFYNGKFYGDNSTKTSSILFHLLALSLNRPDENLDMIASLIDRIPSALKTKEKKIDGNAWNILRKWFLEVLDTSAEFPSREVLEQHGLYKLAFCDFADVVNQIINEKVNDFKKCSTKIVQNVANVREWLEKNTPVAQTPKTENNIHPETKQGNPHQNAENSSKIPAEKKQQAVVDEQDKILKTLQQEIHTLQEEKIELSKQLAGSQGELQRSQRRLSQKALALNDTEKKLSEVRRTDSLKGKQIGELEAIVSQYKDELLKTKEMVEILRRDKEKQSDETVKRLASRLRTYYLDYKDAISLEMSIDLGENMRDQLGEVFKILQDAGIIMK